MNKGFVIRIDEKRCSSILLSELEKVSFLSDKIKYSNGQFFTDNNSLRFIGVMGGEKCKKINSFGKDEFSEIDTTKSFNGDHSILYKSNLYKKLYYYSVIIKRALGKYIHLLYPKAVYIKKLDSDDILEIFVEYFLENEFKEYNLVSSVAYVIGESGDNLQFIGLFTKEYDINLNNFKVKEYLIKNHDDFCLNSLTEVDLL